MVKKLFFVVMLFVVPICVVAQIQVNMPRFSIYNLTPPSLCELNVVNTFSPIAVSLEVTITNFQNDRLVQVITNPFTIPSGFFSIQENNLSIATVNYGSVASAVYLNLNRLLPAGSYTYCARFFQGAKNVGEYRDQLYSDVSNGPFLINPEDKETIQSPHPVFIWNFNDAGMFQLPSMADGAIPSEFYRFYMVAISNDQMAQEAISTNLPLFIKNNLRTNSVQYPVDAPPLQINQRYAWQIQKVSAGQILTTSEAWEFKYDTSKTLIQAKDYVLLEKNKVLTNHFLFNNLRVCYEEILDSGQLKIAFYNTKGRLISNGFINKNVVKGFNCFEIDLEEAAHFVSRKRYLCIIRNTKGEVYQIGFVFNSNL